MAGIVKRSFVQTDYSRAQCTSNTSHSQNDATHGIGYKT